MQCKQKQNIKVLKALMGFAYKFVEANIVHVLDFKEIIFVSVFFKTHCFAMYYKSPVEVDF